MHRQVFDKLVVELFAEKVCWKTSINPPVPPDGAPDTLTSLMGGASIRDAATTRHHLLGGAEVVDGAICR